MPMFLFLPTACRILHRSGFPSHHHILSERMTLFSIQSCYWCQCGLFFIQVWMFQHGGSLGDGDEAWTGCPLSSAIASQAIRDTTIFLCLCLLWVCLYSFSAADHTALSYLHLAFCCWLCGGLGLWKWPSFDAGRRPRCWFGDCASLVEDWWFMRIER